MSNILLLLPFLCYCLSAPKHFLLETKDPQNPTDGRKPTQNKRYFSREKANPKQRKHYRDKDSEETNILDKDSGEKNYLDKGKAGCMRVNTTPRLNQCL